MTQPPRSDKLDKAGGLRQVRRPSPGAAETMSEFDPELPPVLQPAPAPLPPPASHLWMRLLNVFAVPGQVFDEVRRSRHSPGNWLVPTLLCCLALGVSGYVALSVPSVWKEVEKQQVQFRERQSAALDEAVKAGKSTQADADKVLAAFDNVMRPEVLKSFAAAGGVAWGAARVFWWALVLWFLARKFLRHPVAYSKALEVAGLGSMIALLSVVVMLAFTVDLGESFGATGFALSVADLGSPRQQMLASTVLNIVNFWMVAVLGIGLARLTDVPWFRATFLILSYWLLTDLLLLLLGVGSLGR